MNENGKVVDLAKFKRALGQTFQEWLANTKAELSDFNEPEEAMILVRKRDKIGDDTPWRMYHLIREDDDPADGHYNAVFFLLNAIASLAYPKNKDDDKGDAS